MNDLTRSLTAERDAANAAALTAIERLEHLSQRASVFVLHIISGEPFGSEVLKPWIDEITQAAVDAARLRAQVSDAVPERWLAGHVDVASLETGQVVTEQERAHE